VITPGTILIERGTARPDSFHVEDGSYPEAWMTLTHRLTFRQLEDELTATGWTFFYMANSIKAMAFGFDQEKMMHTVLTRLTGLAKDQNCNCLEIKGVATRSFLWMPYLSISAHPRHIQKGMVFSSQ
jgi:hypothetical protein